MERHDYSGVKANGNFKCDCGEWFASLVEIHAHIRFQATITPQQQQRQATVVASFAEIARAASSAHDGAASYPAAPPASDLPVPPLSAFPPIESSIPQPFARSSEPPKAANTDAAGNALLDLELDPYSFAPTQYQGPLNETKPTPTSTPTPTQPPVEQQQQQPQQQQREPPPLQPAPPLQQQPQFAPRQQQPLPSFQQFQPLPAQFSSPWFFMVPPVEPPPVPETVYAQSAKPPPEKLPFHDQAKSALTLSEDGLSTF